MYGVIGAFPSSSRDTLLSFSLSGIWMELFSFHNTSTMLWEMIGGQRAVFLLFQSPCPGCPRLLCCGCNSGWWLAPCPHDHWCQLFCAACSGRPFLFIFGMWLRWRQTLMRGAFLLFSASSPGGSPDLFFGTFKPSVTMLLSKSCCLSWRNEVKKWSHVTFHVASDVNKTGMIFFSSPLCHSCLPAEDR